MPNTVIEVQSLSKTFDEVVAVDKITFSVLGGKTVGLLGGNGAGKTTTIGMLLGLVLPTSGQITMLGSNILTDRYNILHRVNFSSPYVDLPHRLSVRENLRVYAHLYGVNNPKERLLHLADELDFHELLDRRTGTLSAGQKTRVALAKSLINAPEVLLLDEPTASLDPDTADLMRTYLINYQCETGSTILLSSHNMLEVERMCSNVLMMKNGRIIDSGTPPQLKARYKQSDMEGVFLNIARAD